MEKSAHTTVESLDDGAVKALSCCENSILLEFSLRKKNQAESVVASKMKTETAPYFLSIF